VSIRARTFELLARFCQEFDTIAICDEVWEHVILRWPRAYSADAIPGMRDRTIKVGSAGKIFSLTGWKIGFVCAAPPLLRVCCEGAPVSHLHHRANLQVARRLWPRQAGGLFLPDAHGIGAKPRPSHQGIGEHRLSVLRSQGTYFLTVDLSPLGLNETDEAFCKPHRDRLQGRRHTVSAFYERMR